MNDQRPIIVIKRGKAHAGHHGGAWKVAYADFVTAMMALFIVLWLMNTNEQIQKAVAGYFKDPAGTAKLTGTNKAGSGDSFSLTKENMDKLKEELQKSIQHMSDFEQLKDQIEITVTSEGLRVELLETATGTFFNVGNAEPNQNGRELLQTLAAELTTLPNKISIEGHTDSMPYSGRKDYSNWELSTDRANSTRRILQQFGVASSQISQVRGFADRRLKKKDAPNDPANRRISIVILYLDAPDKNDSAK